MRKGRRYAARTAVLVIPFLAVLAGGCGQQEESVEADSRLPVETMTVSLSAVAPTLGYSGTVKAGREALLGAQIQGRVERLHVDIGDRVKEGDLLVEMAGEQLTQVKAQYAVAEKDWERMTALLGKGAVTQQAYDQTDAAYQAAKAAYEMVLESAQIRAPFDGVISARFLDEGEVFTLMPTGAGSPAIFELMQLDPAKIEVNASERERPFLRKGLAAVVTVDGYPGREFHGAIKRIAPAFDPMSRTSTAVVSIPNPDETLRPGMVADVKLSLPERDGLILSRDALMRQEGTGLFFAYVVDDGVARRHDLELGAAFGDGVEVVSGLSEGDEVVLAGRYRLHDGAEVYVRGEEDAR
jgi:RND family efflux transporter MFP subunit